MKPIYLDYASTTPVDPQVVEAMRPYWSENFGNPSSPHVLGRSGRKAVEDARTQISRSLGALPEEIIFTSGGTESNNAALKGLALANSDRGNHIIVSAIEHHSVVRQAQALVSMGFDVTYLNVDRYGKVDGDELRRCINAKTILVAIMHASNEIGTIQPIKALSEILRERNILFHVDGVQTTGHIPVNLRELGCDSFSMSAHKFYGPKGIGGLFLRKGVACESFLLGGDQERMRRASTHNVPGIAGMAKALELALSFMTEQVVREKQFRQYTAAIIQENIAGVLFNGHPEDRLPNNIHVSFEGIDGEALLTDLDMNGFCASMGSACTSGQLSPSHVLKAIGLSDALALGSLRVSFGRWTTHDEVEAFCCQLVKSVQRMRQR